MTTNHFEPLAKVRTKIVATVGPASRDPAVLKQMVEAGVDVFRLNFSHGTHEQHSKTFRAIRAISQEMDHQLAVLQDLCGPKIRLGTILPATSSSVTSAPSFYLTAEPEHPDDPHQLTCTIKSLPDDLEVGQSVLFADGTVAMDVIERRPGWARLKVTLPGRIRSHQGINVPSAALSVDALTEKDLDDLNWTATHGVAYVGLSFVRRVEDITRLRAELDKRNSRARIVAKIEKPQAVANLEAIIAEADAVMVARGDLGVEIDVSKVPAVQKQIIDACHKARVPVITATQMLNSMESSSRPTRAEASDVFNAVLDGTDAVMLSGETAIGQFPVEAVATMSQIAREAEQLMFSQFGSGAPWTWSRRITGRRPMEVQEALRATFMSPEPVRCCRSPTRSSRPQAPCAGGCRPPCWWLPRIPDGPRWPSPSSATPRPPWLSPTTPRPPAPWPFTGASPPCTSPSFSRPARCSPSPTSGAALTT